MNRNDDELEISRDDARFAEKLGALYRPPEATATARARFAAGLDEHIARGPTRRPWLVCGAVAAAAVALTFVLLPGGEPEPSTASIADIELPTTDESLLLIANGPLDDPDEALPEDYQTLASLLD
jgi:hypothetical protein